MTSIFAIDFTFEKNVHTKKSEKKLTHTHTHTHTHAHTHTRSYTYKQYMHSSYIHAFNYTSIRITLAQLVRTIYTNTSHLNT